MAEENSINALPVLCAAILTAAALYFGSAIFAPVAVSLFVIAILWPLQKSLESRIPRLIALCAQAAGMISVDTGPGHVAAAVGCPVVTLFGQANPLIYVPRGPQPRTQYLQGSAEGERAMMSITPAAVLATWQQTV